MPYTPLTNDRLNLATAYERWQMANYGNVLPTGQGIAPEDDDQRREEEKQTTLITIENEQL